MRATKGDLLTMPGRHVGDSDRSGEVLEVRGADGSPPYVVRWRDGHDAVVYPGPEARVRHPDATDHG